MSRETVNRGLVEIAAQLADLKAKANSANFAALRASSALAEIDEFGQVMYSEPFSEVELGRRLATAQAERAAYRGMQVQFDKIGREIVQDGDDWETECQSYERMFDRFAQQKPVTKNLPLLSVAAEKVITAKSEALTKNRHPTLHGFVAPSALSWRSSATSGSRNIRRSMSRNMRLRSDCYQALGRAIRGYMKASIDLACPRSVMASRLE